MAIVEFGDSQTGLTSEFGISGPGGFDIPVLKAPAYGPNGGLKAVLPQETGPLSSYTLVWDVYYQSFDANYIGLLQTDPNNGNDGDLFIHSGGIGISAKYDGTVPTGQWARIAITVEDLGNGNAQLKKFIDGTLVGSQTVDSSRFTLEPEGFLLMTDNDGETAPAFLAHVGLSQTVLSEQAIAGLGAVDGDGPFAAGAGAAQFGFDTTGPAIEAGFASAEFAPGTQAGTPATTIGDMLVSLSDGPKSYDLDALFDLNNATYTVTGSNGEAVEAVIEDGILTLSFDALGLSDLTITATYSGSLTKTENVRVRVAGEDAYTIAVLPDTQDYTLNLTISPTFGHMTDWLAANAEGKNLSFVTHVGDVTYNAQPYEYRTAKDAMDTLREAGIPFSVLPGNHDIGDNGSSNIRKTDAYNDAFSVAYMSADPTFAGAYDQEPDRYDNSYHLFTAPDGTGWIVLNLEFGPRDDVLRWADDVLTQYGDRKAFVLTHSMSNFDGRHDSLGSPLNAEGAGYNYGLGKDAEGAWDGETIYREVLDRHPNVVFTAGGHIFGDGAETTVSYNDFGNKVYQFLVNYQGGVSSEITGAGSSIRGGNGGNGAIRLITVDPENDAVYTETYFTELDTYFTDVREKEELDRDGLTGSYKGHEETLEEANIGVREAQAIADAGDDLVAQAATGADTAQVTLSAARTSNPQGDITAYKWFDADGSLIGEGETAIVALAGGTHDLTLVVETARGISHSDALRVIVETDDTLLIETFNDGDASAWVSPGDAAPDFAVTSTDLSAGLPAVDGDISQQALTLAFDSHWRPEDDQVAEVWVSIDGADPIRLLRWDSSNTSDDGSLENTRVELEFQVADQASDVQFQFAMPQAGNDWFWAIDNLELTGPGGEVLMRQDFDGLADRLQTPVDEAGIDPNLAGWTQETPEGWEIENGASMPQGAAEWQGWSFATMDFWTAADNQRRGDFTKASGVLAIADPDEWDDFNAGTQTGKDFNSTLKTPTISLAPLGLGGGSAGGETDILRVDALKSSQALELIAPDAGVMESYTLVMDLYVEEGTQDYTALLQSDASNGSDAELFLRNNGDGTAGLGISADYDGELTYGAWTRVAVSVSVEGNSQVMRKYIDGALVGTQTVDLILSDGGRFTLDGEAGILLFADNSGETSPLSVASLALVPEALSEGVIAGLGGATPEGPFASPPAANAVQFSFADGDMSATDFGAARLATKSLAQESNFKIKGTVASRSGADSSLEAVQGTLFNQAGDADDMVVFGGGAWSDIRLQTTIRSLDDEGMGVLFRFVDGQNYYLLRLDSQANSRQLIRVENGVQTVLAQEAGGYRFYDEIDVEITAEGGAIGVSLDGIALFGGTVLDGAPLGAGTVGYYSSGNFLSSFDDMVVDQLGLEARAGHDRMLVDFDGDGKVAVTLDGGLSTGVESAEWAGVGAGLTRSTEAMAGEQSYTLALNGGAASDSITIQVASGDRLIAADQFEDGDFAGWRIVDTTELDGDGRAASGSAGWQVIDGALVETSGASSRELTWSGASSSDVWKRGWSPHGDGVYALHKGTYALWEGDQTLEDYAIEAVISLPEASGGVGFMLNWVDPDNYYKLELDVRHNLTTLVQVVEGYETYLGRVRGTFTPGEEFHLRAAHVDGKMQAWIDDHQIFAYEHESHENPIGAAGLYAWGAQGVRFDDVAIVDLAQPFLQVVSGSSARDELQGSAAAERFMAGGGRSDRMTGGAGADQFVFAAETRNGRRETDIITDYEAGVDALDLGGARIARIREFADKVRLKLDGDGDLIWVHGVDSADDITFL